MRVAAVCVSLCLVATPLLAQDPQQCPPEQQQGPPQPQQQIAQEPIVAPPAAARIERLTGRPVTVLANGPDGWSLELPGSPGQPPIVVERVRLSGEPSSQSYALDEALGPGSQTRAVADVRGDTVMIVRNTTPGRARALLTEAWKDDPRADQRSDLIGMRDERGSVSLVRDARQGTWVVLQRGPNQALLDALLTDVSRLGGLPRPTSRQGPSDATPRAGQAESAPTADDAPTREPASEDRAGPARVKSKGINSRLGG